jgi:hypothetical protein
MLEGVDLADIHGQDKFNFQHAAISREQSKKFLDWAFRRDFERNGPSMLSHLPHHAGTAGCGTRTIPTRACAQRFEWEARSLKDGYASGAVGHGSASR